MKAAIYARVSTLEQATEGYSIGVQKEKLTHYANAQNYEIADVYSDEGFSGKDLMRPAMLRMLDDVRSGKIDIVLIYKLDRLSRHVKDVLELVETFDKYKVTLYSLNENLDLSSPFGRAALKMSATFSELERETIVERMEMGKHARARSGKYSCPGKSPFGYKLNKETDRLEIVPEEAEAVRDMYAKYIEGYSFRKLYRYCKAKYPGIRFFSNSMCCKPVIERPMYAGYFIHNGELIKATNYEPIISYETYLQAQEAVKRNLTKREHDNTPYLLTGLIFCGQCGRAYCGKRRTHKYNAESLHCCNRLAEFPPGCCKPCDKLAEFPTTYYIVAASSRNFRRVVAGIATGLLHLFQPVVTLATGFLNFLQPVAYSASIFFSFIRSLSSMRREGTVHIFI